MQRAIPTNITGNISCQMVHLFFNNSITLPIYICILAVFCVLSTCLWLSCFFLFVNIGISNFPQSKAIPVSKFLPTIIVSCRSISQKTDETIKTDLIDPLRQILKDKSRASAKCDFLCSCLAHKTTPKGVTPNVPLKILNAPKDLEDKWHSILQTKSYCNYS